MTKPGPLSLLLARIWAIMRMVLEPWVEEVQPSNL
jgi:hypothetical protein